MRCTTEWLRPYWQTARRRGEKGGMMPSGTDFLEAIRAAYAEVHGHLGTFRYWHTTWLAGVSYVVTSTALFGGCSSPIGMLLFLNDRLDYRYWFGPLLAGLAIGALLALVLRLSSRTVGGILAPAVFVTVSMVTSVALTAAPVDRAREQAIAKFMPDRVIDHSLWRSLREAPRKFQFYLHTAALKQCEICLELSADGLLPNTTERCC